MNDKAIIDFLNTLRLILDDSIRLSDEDTETVTFTKAFVKNIVKRIEEGVLQPMRETPMLPYQQRVIDEKAELDERLVKLLNFPKFADLPQPEQDRMWRQAKHMKRYSDILGERIEAWEQTEK